MTLTVTLKIDNCLDCPHSKLHPSVIFDSWDYADEDLVCTKKSRSRHDVRHETVKGKPIFIMERYNHRKHAAVPKWCPLLKESVKR